MERHNRAFQFHPYEVAFCGYSHSGKTTLITHLLEKFSGSYTIGYIKHDVHSFGMDHQGKDTFRAKASGARTVFISDPNHYALIRSGQIDPVIYSHEFLDNDLVFVEGYKSSDVPKFILVDDRAEILEKEKSLRHVIAYVGDLNQQSMIPARQTYFHRDDVEGISQCLLAHFKKRVGQIPIYGLVLAGGKSTRMKKDKSQLEYHGQKQSVHCFELLSKYCDQVFISNRQHQVYFPGHKALPQIHDTFTDIGPLGGILSAMTRSPEAAWLVLACDLPFVKPRTIETLIHRRNPFKMATAYQNAENHLPEPLCAIYEPKAVFRLLQFLACGIHCPRKILLNSSVELIPPDENLALDNVNTPEEYSEAIQRIKKMD